MGNLRTNVADTIDLEPLFLFSVKRNFLVDGKAPLLCGHSLDFAFHSNMNRSLVPHLRFRDLCSLLH